MARILIADDDSNLRGTLEEALTNAGHEVTSAANGELALQAFEAAAGAGTPFAVAVVDLLLPKIPGFDLATQMRTRDPALKVAFITGVFKTAAHKADADQKYAPIAYLSKPFGNDQLIQVIEKAVGKSKPKVTTAAPAYPMPPEGNLLEAPVVHLLWRAAREGQTGILDVMGAEGKRGRAFVYRGRLTLGQTADPTINVGIELVRQGALTPEMYRQAQALANERRQGLYAIIKAEGWADDNAFRDAYKTVSPRAVATFIGANGRFRWTDGDAFAKIVPAAPTDLMPVLRTALRTCPSSDLAAHVDPRGPLRLAPGPNWDEISAILEDACGSSSLTRAINGRATIAQMLAAARNDDDRAQRYRQAHLLMSTQGVIASMEPIQMARPAEPAPAAPAAAPTRPAPAAQAAPAASSSPRTAPAPAPGADNIDFTRDEIIARKRIEEKYAALKNATPFEIIGVDEHASPGDIKKAYFALAREWHTDSFVGLRLGSAAQTLDLLFGLIQDANATLTDPTKRGELDAQREMEQAGMSTDIAALFEAEADVHKGRMLLERGEMLAASKLFERAVSVNPANSEWKALHLYSRWFQRKNPDEAVEIVAQLEVIAKEMPTVMDIPYFAGNLCLEIGNLKKAKTLLKRVTTEEPGHAMANRALRALQKKAEDEEKKAKGGIGGFFKR